MHFLGFRFAPPQAIFRARLRRLRASVLGHDVKQVNGLGGTVPNFLEPFPTDPNLILKSPAGAPPKRLNTRLTRPTYAYFGQLWCSDYRLHHSQLMTRSIARSRLWSNTLHFH